MNTLKVKASILTIFALASICSASCPIGVQAQEDSQGAARALRAEITALETRYRDAIAGGGSQAIPVETAKKLSAARARLAELTGGSDALPTGDADTSPSPIGQSGDRPILERLRSFLAESADMHAASTQPASSGKMSPAPASAHDAVRSSIAEDIARRGVDAFLSVDRPVKDLLIAGDILVEAEDDWGLAKVGEALRKKCPEGTSERAEADEIVKVLEASEAAGEYKAVKEGLNQKYKSAFKFLNPMYYVEKAKAHFGGVKKSRDRAKQLYHALRRGLAEARIANANSPSPETEARVSRSTARVARVREILIASMASGEDEATILGDLNLVEAADPDTEFSARGFETGKHEFTLWMIPSPTGQDWSTPIKLFLSGIPNQVDFRHRKDKHSIGHVFIELRNPKLPGGRVMTGMTTVNNTQEIDLAIKYGYLFGVLFADLDGKLDDPAKLDASVAGREKTGCINYIRYLLSPENSNRLADFFNEYKARECHLHYGGPHRPRYSEGGGCSGFGMSFVEVGGFMKDEYVQKWQRHLKIPMRLIGGPMTGVHLSAWKLFTGIANTWARDGEDFRPLMMWEPDLMSQWVRKTWTAEYERPGTTGFFLEKRGRARGLVVDARKVPPPDEPMFIYDGPEKSYTVPVTEY